MHLLRCSYCKVEFESADRRALCPRGCVLDRSEASAPGIYTTARMVQPDRDLLNSGKKAEKKSASKKPGKKAQDKEEASPSKETPPPAPEEKVDSKSVF